jgi:hypothetical protein
MKKIIILAGVAVALAALFITFSAQSQMDFNGAGVNIVTHQEPEK